MINYKNYIRKLKGKIFPYYDVDQKDEIYLRKFKKFSFFSTKCIDEKQYEAVITRFSHTIEKGLSYLNYRPCFGKDNINALISAMKNYLEDGYDADSIFFRTALSTLSAYIEKNKKYGIKNSELEKNINNFGCKNEFGGVVLFSPLSDDKVKQLGFDEFVKNRHSMRHFSNKPVDIELVKKAIKSAQYTPSACNRQGWRTVIISDKEIMKKVCANQNGNEGFGNEFDKILLVTSDLRCFNRDRELYQAFIDGGMYAQNLLNALHYQHIASVPLSASLNNMQENNVRNILNLHEAEILILFIGIGNYPEVCQTARSERRPAEITIV
jgi:nitroreductase